ncbi:hypothetical protein [Wohlfahrtiimonas chitiniclastica]|uniref:hypothetical protein n=1 Tax=Wohlfahrtiimonas chitiniclastica TaxID=400946 RepID=UPI001BD0C6A6|nr:hypothetical protein [Wohlfahrtiimonas chitiniclastica]
MFELLKLILTTVIPIIGWWFGWWVANNNFKKQRYDKVKENILLEIKNLKNISVSHYTKRDNSPVYVLQSFKELTNFLVEEHFIIDENSQLTPAWREFRIAATKHIDNDIIYKHDSKEIDKVLITYNHLHKQLLKHKFNSRKKRAS